MVRRNGRAPYWGSKPFSMRKSLAFCGMINSICCSVNWLRTRLRSKSTRVHFFHAQGMEDDDFIDTVQELRFEGVFEFTQNLALHAIVLVLIGFGFVL